MAHRLSVWVLMSTEGKICEAGCFSVEVYSVALFAGADIIISYYTPMVLEWLGEKWWCFKKVLTHVWGIVVRTLKIPQRGSVCAQFSSKEKDALSSGIGFRVRTESGMICAKLNQDRDPPPPFLWFCTTDVKNTGVCRTDSLTTKWFWETYGILLVIQHGRCLFWVCWCPCTSVQKEKILNGTLTWISLHEVQQRQNPLRSSNNMLLH